MCAGGASQVSPGQVMSLATGAASAPPSRHLGVPHVPRASPHDLEEIADVRSDLAEMRIFEGILISKDGRSAAIFVGLDPEAGGASGRGGVQARPGILAGFETGRIAFSWSARRWRSRSSASTSPGPSTPAASRSQSSRSCCGSGAVDLGRAPRPDQGGRLSRLHVWMERLVGLPSTSRRPCFRSCSRRSCSPTRSTSSGTTSACSVSRRIGPVGD